MKCKACGSQIVGEWYLPDVTDGEGQPVLEICCHICVNKAFQNEVEGYYDGFWLDKNGHESHIVYPNPEDYMI